MEFIENLKTRRQFLKFMGRGTAALYGSSLLMACASNLTTTAAKRLGLAPSSADTVTLVDGLSYNVVAKWQDAINRKDGFGFNNDFIALVSNKTGENFLWVNHESTDPLFVSQYTGGQKSRTQYELEAKSVGGSFIKVIKSDNGWFLTQDARNFRVDGLTKIPFAWPKPIIGSTFAKGMVANCGGGTTPWGTLLTCEENFHEFYGETWIANNKRQFKDVSKYGWFEFAPEPPERYGWVVEIDPWKKSAKKLVALGRFAHENACVVVAPDGRPVVYMGDDAENEFIYKFIAAKPGSLEEGELFAADTVKGQWLSLSWDKQPVLKKRYASQTEVQIYAREAARLLGATPQNRPEDLEYDKVTGAIFVTLTNNKKTSDHVGQIAKIEELDGLTGLKLKMSSFLMGGKQNNFACPDNMAFDPKGNLWFTSDISEKLIESGPYTGLGNNSLFVVPMSGRNAGMAIRVATAPVDAEFTGPCFSTDGNTLFLSVQHPGAQSKKDQFTSHWPDGGTSMPRPSVIAIQGEALASF